MIMKGIFNKKFAFAITVIFSLISNIQAQRYVETCTYDELHEVVIGEYMGASAFMVVGLTAYLDGLNKIKDAGVYYDPFNTSSLTLMAEKMKDGHRLVRAGIGVMSVGSLLLADAIGKNIRLRIRASEARRLVEKEEKYEQKMLELKVKLLEEKLKRLESQK